MPKSLVILVAIFGSLLNGSDAAFVIGGPSTRTTTTTKSMVHLHAVAQEQEESHSFDGMSRREMFRHGALMASGVATASSFLNTNFVGVANAAESIDTMVADLQSAKAKLDQVPDLLKAEKWDEVRTILKTPPVNYLWNMGDGQNTLLKIAKATDEMELIELKDELSLSIQMCDQLTYDNVFVYFQPGNGKVKIKEPVELATKAIKQLAEAIDLAKGS
mmetsp:Transcript_18312/g.25819  ORF Transcript_18312/g.25819 Transcript_18312/m.25819 type:complete len:218 (-) Transcript_18312:125-778(-)